MSELNDLKDWYSAGRTREEIRASKEGQAYKACCIALVIASELVTDRYHH